MHEKFGTISGFWCSRWTTLLQEFIHKIAWRIWKLCQIKHFKLEGKQLQQHHWRALNSASMLPEAIPLQVWLYDVLALDQCLDLVLLVPHSNYEQLWLSITAPSNQAFGVTKPGLAHFFPQFESQAGWKLILTAVAASWWSPTDRDENFPPAGADLMTYFKGISVRIKYLIDISPAMLRKPQKELAHASGISTKIASVCKPIQIKNWKQFFVKQLSLK